MEEEFREVQAGSSNNLTPSKKNEGAKKSIKNAPGLRAFVIEIRSLSSLFARTGGHFSTRKLPGVEGAVLPVLTPAWLQSVHPTFLPGEEGTGAGKLLP